MTREDELKSTAAEPLWQLLDDIDTLDDICKSDDAWFRRAAMDLCVRRHAYAQSPDGQTLTWSTDEPPAPTPGRTET